MASSFLSNGSYHLNVKRLASKNYATLMTWLSNIKYCFLRSQLFFKWIQNWSCFSSNCPIGTLPTIQSREQWYNRKNKVGWWETIIFNLCSQIIRIKCLYRIHPRTTSFYTMWMKKLRINEADLMEQSRMSPTLNKKEFIRVAPHLWINNSSLSATNLCQPLTDKYYKYIW